MNSSESAKKNRSIYLVDKRLIPRIKQYIANRSNVREFNVDDITTYMQENFSEYRRKKRNNLLQSIKKAYQIIRKANAEESQLQRLEDNHVKRKSKIRKVCSDDNTFHGNTASDSDSSDLSLNKMELDIKDEHNLMNQSILATYKNTNELTGNEDPTKNPTDSMERSSYDANVTKAVNSGEEATLNQKHRKDGVKKHRDRSKEKNISVPATMSSDIELIYPKVKFANLGGMDEVLWEVCSLLHHILHPEIFEHFRCEIPCGFLLHGPPGCGKTLLANAIAGELEFPLIKLAATEIVSGVSGESEKKIRDIFNIAKANSPSVLFLDEIDSITQKRELAQREMEKRIVTQLLSCMDDICSSPKNRVLVIGATNRPDTLDPALRRAGRFDKEISIGIPDEKCRKSILEILCSKVCLEDNFDFDILAHLTPGFVGADLAALLNTALTNAITRVFKEMDSSLSLNSPTAMIDYLKNQRTLSESELKSCSLSVLDFKDALKVIQPSSKREGFATVPDVTWDNIGALKDIRQILKMAIVAPVRYRSLSLAYGISKPPGVLLAGPPGCGKTLIAKAIANESGLNFIAVKGPELMNMYVGESERAVRQVFQRARCSAPCVIFFDELDALCPRRLDKETSVSDRVVNQMLTEMDGIENRKQVFIIGATNKPDKIDPAILRPGRLDKTLYVGLPDAADRALILHTIIKSKPADLFESVHLDEIACSQRCEGFSGADLDALVTEACMTAFEEALNHEENNSNSNSFEVDESFIQKIFDDKKSTNSIHAKITPKHFDIAFSKVKPSISEEERRKYEKLRKRYSCSIDDVRSSSVNVEN